MWSLLEGCSERNKRSCHNTRKRCVCVGGGGIVTRGHSWRWLTSHCSSKTWHKKNKKNSDDKILAQVWAHMMKTFDWQLRRKTWRTLKLWLKLAALLNLMDPLCSILVLDAHFRGNVHEVKNVVGILITTKLNARRYGDHYEWNKAVTCIHNVLSQQRWLEHYGEVVIRNTKSDECTCKMTFVKARCCHVCTFLLPVTDSSCDLTDFSFFLFL